jgi:hypothetical protein
LSSSPSRGTIDGLLEPSPRCVTVSRSWVGDYPAFGDGGEVEFFSQNKPLRDITPNSKWNAVYGASVTPSMTESVSIGGSTIASAAPNDQQPWVTSWSPREQDMNLNDLQYTATVTFRNNSVYTAFRDAWGRVESERAEECRGLAVHRHGHLPECGDGYRVSQQCHR